MKLYSRWDISGLREQWEKMPGTVTQTQGLLMVDTIDKLLAVKEAAERYGNGISTWAIVKRAIRECEEVERE